jgi:hypothetical protein
MSASNSLTQAVIKYCTLRGYKVWRQNNLAVPGRRFAGLLGIPDVIGFQKGSGIFIGVETKIGKDKLSLHQIEFGLEIVESGGLWFVARDIESFIEAFENTLNGDLSSKYVQAWLNEQKKLLHERHSRRRSNPANRKRGN